MRPTAALITTGTVLAAEPSRGAAFRAFDLARAAGLPLIFDIDYRPYCWPSAARSPPRSMPAPAALCDVVVGNDEEFGFMAGATAGGLDAARALVGARRGRIVDLQDGRARARSPSPPDGEIRTGIYRRRARSSPPGPATLSWAASSRRWRRARTVEAAMLRGSAAAAIVVARVGCAPAMPTAAELEAFLAAHPGPTAA